MTRWWRHLSLHGTRVRAHARLSPRARAHTVPRRRRAARRLAARARLATLATLWNMANEDVRSRALLTMSAALHGGAPSGSALPGAVALTELPLHQFEDVDVSGAAPLRHWGEGRYMRVRVTVCMCAGARDACV